MIKSILLAAFLACVQSQPKTYTAHDCKNGKITDIGLNPSDHRKKAKIVYKEGETKLAKWKSRHYAKFDPNFVSVTGIILDEGEVYNPHLFISE